MRRSAADAATPQATAISPGCRRGASPAVELGPFLLARTPHQALAAPYHRNGDGITAGHAIFAAPPDEARRLVAERRVTYVAVCGGTGPMA
jgi:hypothetical protein